MARIVTANGAANMLPITNTEIGQSVALPTEASGKFRSINETLFDTAFGAATIGG